MPRDVWRKPRKSTPTFSTWRLHSAVECILGLLPAARRTTWRSCSENTSRLERTGDLSGSSIIFPISSPEVTKPRRSGKRPAGELLMMKAYRVVVLSQSLTRRTVPADSPAYLRTVLATSRADAISRCWDELLPLMEQARAAGYRTMSVYCAQANISPLRIDPVSISL